jgi:hypothetical protein
LKTYVWNVARPDGSMVEGYTMEETIGFWIDYMKFFNYKTPSLGWF